MLFKFKLRSILSALTILFFYISCSKSKTDSIPQSSQNVQNFLKHNSDAPNSILRIISLISEYNLKYSFLEKFTTKHGYALWNDAQIFTAETSSTKRDTILVIPLVKKDQKRVTAFLACMVTPDTVLIKFFRADRYGTYANSNRTDRLTSTFIANQIMYFDYLTFGYSKFLITDSTIFNYPEVPLSKEKTRYLMITDRKNNQSAREMGLIYITGSTC